MKKYRVKDSVKFELNDDELLIVDMETGFVGKGNACAYSVISALSEKKTEEELIHQVSEKYPESQNDRVKKSVPKIVEWLLERGLIETSE